MILPIRPYGDSVLRKNCTDIAKDFPNLKQLITDMFDTMYEANGVGLAAPQIGLNIRLFIIDTHPFADDQDYKNITEELKLCKKVFINAKILNEFGNEWKFNEGCLSIPNIREDVSRYENITIEYYDENWVHHKETFSDIRARVIQHEYDHIEGILFTDHLSPLKKRILQKKLLNITKGNVDVDYKMKFIN